MRKNCCCLAMAVDSGSILNGGEWWLPQCLVTNDDLMVDDDGQLMTIMEYNG